MILETIQKGSELRMTLDKAESLLGISKRTIFREIALAGIDRNYSPKPNIKEGKPGRKNIRTLDFFDISRIITQRRISNKTVPSLSTIKEMLGR